MFTNKYLFYGDGYDGLPEDALFDKILITAAAPFVPSKLVEQLKWDGKMVLPLGEGKWQVLVRITKINDEEIRKEQYDNFTFVPMLGGIRK